jgi:hypothetical protein
LHGAGNRRRGPGGEVDAELGEESLRASRGSWIPLVRLLELLRRCYRGQGGRWSTGGEQSRRRRVLPAAALVEKSGACRLEVEGSKLGEGLAHKAELQMLLAWAGRPWRGRSAAEQRCGGSAEQDVRRLGFGRGATG